MANYPGGIAVDFLTLRSWSVRSGHLAYMSTMPLSGTYGSNQPVTIGQHDNYGGAIAGQYWDNDWGERLQCIPGRYNAGLVVNPIATSVILLNTGSGAATIGSITKTGDNGVAINYPGTPFVLGPRKHSTYDVNIDPEEIDLVLLAEFYFNATTSGLYRIVGESGTLNLLPYQYDNGVAEVIKHVTDVQGSVGAEQRFKLREVPDILIEANYTLEPQENRDLYTRLYKYATKSVYVPLWMDAYQIYANLVAGGTAVSFPTADLRFKAGGTCLIWQDVEHFEGIGIDTVTGSGLTFKTELQNDYSGRMFIVPLRKGQIIQAPSLTKHNMGVGKHRIQYRLQEIYDEVAPTLTQFNGYDVVEDRNFMIEPITESVHAENEVIDFKTGPFTRFIKFSRIGEHSSQNWIAWGTAEKAALRQFMYSRKGRFKPFYLISWNPDIIPTLIVTSAETAVTIEPHEYVDYGTRAIRIELKNGNVYYRNATFTDKNAMTLDAALGEEVHPEDWYLVSIMHLVRFSQDNNRIVYESMGAKASGQVVTFQ